MDREWRALCGSIFPLNLGCEASGAVARPLFNRKIACHPCHVIANRLCRTCSIHVARAGDYSKSDKQMKIAAQNLNLPYSCDVTCDQ